MTNQDLAQLFAEIAAAFARYAASAPAASAPAASAPAASAPAASAPAASAPAASAPAASAPAASAPAAPVQHAALMTAEQFSIEGTNLLQRHGGNQAPLLPVMAKWGVSAPATELRPEQYAPFLADLKAAYGEV